MKRAGQEAGLPFPVHPHMLRDAKGFNLAQKGVDPPIQGFLGHRDIKSTVIYTSLTRRGSRVSKRIDADCASRIRHF